MRKILIGIGVLFLSTTALAYSASFNADSGRTRSEINRQLTIHPELNKVRWRVGRLRGDLAGGRYDTKLNIAMVDPRGSIFSIRKTMVHELESTDP